MTIWFHITDASGIIVSSVKPTVTSGGGAVLAIDSLDASFPGVWGVNVRAGSGSGTSNVFTLAAGSLT